jgi:hypothetical protein
MLCLSGLLVAPTTFAATPAASSTVDRIQVKAGETITVKATGFNANEKVSSWASSARGSVYPTTGGTADSSGNVTLTFRLGRFWEPTWWASTVHGLSSGLEAITTFEVLASPPDGTLDVDTTSVAPGGRISFHGGGFANGEVVSVWVTRPDGTTTSISTNLPSTNGDIYFFYDVPVGAAPGVWSATAYGTTSNRLLVVTFTVKS